MSNVETISIPDAGATPRAYRDALLALVGERDPLEILAGTLDRVRELIAGHAAATLERHPAPGEWSAAEILGHLVDAEMVGGFRLRFTLTADRPTYPAYDEKRWSDLPRPPVDQIAAAWIALRTYNLALIRAIPRAHWQRVGIHAEQGPETIETYLRKNAGHDLAHLNQLERALAG